MVEKIKYNNLNWLGEPDWSRSVETVYEKEGEHVLEAAPLTVGAGPVELDGGKSICPGIFLGVLRDSQIFIGVDRS